VTVVSFTVHEEMDKWPCLHCCWFSEVEAGSQLEHRVFKLGWKSGFRIMTNGLMPRSMGTTRLAICVY